MFIGEEKAVLAVAGLQHRAHDGKMVGKKSFGQREFSQVRRVDLLVKIREPDLFDILEAVQVKGKIGQLIFAGRLGKAMAALVRKSVLESDDRVILRPAKYQGKGDSRILPQCAGEGLLAGTVQTRAGGSRTE